MPSSTCKLEVEITSVSDRQSMLAALRIVLGLPRQIPPVFPDDLLSVGNQSNRYVPDRTDHHQTRVRGQEDEA